jgi:hypothetical protein
MWNEGADVSFSKPTRGGSHMKLTIIALAAAGLMLTVPVALAGPGKSGNTPGHMMQRYGSVPGHPGASGYAPGHLKKHHRSTVGLAVRHHGRKHHR